MTTLPVNQILCGNCIEVLKEFPDDSIDTIFNNPGGYDAEACKSTVANRFELHRKSINKIKINRLPPETFHIPKPEVHRMTKVQLARFCEKGDKENA